MAILMLQKTQLNESSLMLWNFNVLEEPQNSSVGAHRY